VNKTQLLETIEINRRQLERYLFYFERDADGDFQASDRPKFDHSEMLRPGVVDDWSLKDLLSHIIDWDRRLVVWCSDALTGFQGTGPELDLRWENLDTGDHEIPADLRGESIDAILTEFRQSYRVVLSTLAALREEVLFGTGSTRGGRGPALADLVLLSTADHYAWAKGRIRRWCKTHAGAYLNREIILARIQTERRRLEQNLAEVPRGEMETPGVVGEWSVKDMIAHLVDWEQRFLGWYEAGRRGQRPEVPAPGIGWDQLDLLNRQIYEQNRERPVDEILAEFDASYPEVLETIRAMPEDEIFAVGRYDWLGENSLVGVILANTANHYRWAKGHIRAWRSQHHGDQE
jgi:hypothetical protein